MTAPVAGTSYGGHGVWGWDDGTRQPTDHAGSGIPLPWRKALLMPGAEQMRHVSALFTSIEFWRLRPAPDVLAEQPGVGAPDRFVAAAASPDRDVLVLYTPEVASLRLNTAAIPQGRATWFDPRTGARRDARSSSEGAVTRFQAPGPGDWVLIVVS
jgi:hypothetical protein